MEQMSSGLPPKTDIATYSQHVSNVARPGHSFRYSRRIDPTGPEVFKSCDPRPANVKAAPATRSVTTRDTGLRRAATGYDGAKPAMHSDAADIRPLISISPVVKTRANGQADLPCGRSERESASDAAGPARRKWPKCRHRWTLIKVPRCFSTTCTPAHRDDRAICARRGRSTWRRCASNRRYP